MSSIDRRPGGNYRARWREYPGGPQKTRSFARKVDASRFLTSVEHSQLTGTYVAPEAGLVSLRAYTEVVMARSNWRPSTMRNATVALGRAFPLLGDRPLSSIRRGDVLATLAGLEVGQGSRRLVHHYLAHVFTAAVEDGLLARSPLQGVKRPVAPKVEVVPPTTEQVNALLATAEPWFRPAVVLGAGLGLRQSEVTGLTVDRVDWMRRTVRIDRQWTGRDGVTFGPPKTSASVRTIPAAAAVLAELGAHVDQRQEGFVVEVDGQAVANTRFALAWNSTRDRAGLPGIKFHDLRHHFASRLIAHGCSVKAVQHAVGHGSAGVTLDTYAHLWPGDEDRIRAAVEAAFAPAEDLVRTDTAS